MALSRVSEWASTVLPMPPIPAGAVSARGWTRKPPASRPVIGEYQRIEVPVAVSAVDYELLAEVDTPSHQESLSPEEQHGLDEGSSGHWWHGYGLRLVAPGYALLSRATRAVGQRNCHRVGKNWEDVFWMRVYFSLRGGVAIVWSSHV